MIGFLRFAGIFNAAVWLGALIFFAFGAEPALGSDDVRSLLQKSFAYISDAVAQTVHLRMFYWSLACGIVASLHLFAEWLYLGRSARRFSAWLLVLLLTLTMISGCWVQPQIRTLHIARFLGVTPAERQKAQQSIGHWRRISTMIDLFLMLGVTAYLWRTSNPPDKLRFLDPMKVRS